MAYHEISSFGRTIVLRSVPRAADSPVHGQNRASGFTLIEILIICALISTLSLIVIPSALGITERTKNMQAMADLRKMDTDIAQYIMDYNVPPDSLAEVGYDTLRDPWGNPYQYLKIFESTEPGVNGKRRKDHSLVPVNSDFDLYSMGADGDSAGPLSAKKSRDDIVRANNGAFIGLGEDY